MQAFRMNTWRTGKLDEVDAADAHTGPDALGVGVGRDRLRLVERLAHAAPVIRKDAPVQHHLPEQGRAQREIER